MTTDITTTNTNAPATFTFKNARLNEISTRISILAKQSADTNRAVAVELATVATEDLYKEDGFKSVADYAEQTFGIKKAMAYQLAKVGSKFAKSDNPAMKRLYDTLPVTTLAELATVPDEALIDMEESGMLDSCTTQKQAREIAKSTPKSGESEVVQKAKAEPRRKYSAIVCDFNNGFITVPPVDTTESEFYSKTFQGNFQKFTVQRPKLPIQGETTMGIYLVSYDNGFARVMVDRADPVKAEPAEAKPKFTREQLMEMLAALDE